MGGHGTLALAAVRTGREDPQSYSLPGRSSVGAAATTAAPAHPAPPFSKPTAGRPAVGELAAPAGVREQRTIN
ncbi:MAG: hypothetical protein ACK52I_17155 [Pseudomonadota bacterium]